MERFVGGSAGGVVLRLAVISIVVGVVLSALDWNIPGLVEAAKTFFRSVLENGWSLIDALFRYLLIGAIVVVPIWAAVQIVRMIFRKPDRRDR